MWERLDARLVQKSSYTFLLYQRPYGATNSFSFLTGFHRRRFFGHTRTAAPVVCTASCPVTCLTLLIRPGSRTRNRGSVCGVHKPLR